MPHCRWVAMLLIVGCFAMWPCARSPLAVEGQATSILDQLEKLESRLGSTKARIRELEEKQKQLDEQMATSHKHVKQSQEKIERQQSLLALRIRETYKLQSLGDWEYLLASGDFSEFVMRNQYLSRLAKADRAIIATYQNGVADWQSKRNALEKSKRELDALLLSLAEQRKQLDGKLAERKAFLKRVQKEKALREQAQRELADANKQLSRKVATLQAAPQTEKSSTSTQRSFSDSKGQLPCPVSGKIEVDFGELKEDRERRFHGGLDLRAPNGHPIKAPFSAVVLFAGRLRGFGNLIVLDHGEKYYTLYAHLRELTHSKGQKLQAGELIGYVGDTGSLKGSFLYFELRHSGKAVDPGNWFSCR